MPTLRMVEPQEYWWKTSQIRQKLVFWPLYGWGSVIWIVGLFFFSGFPRPYAELYIYIGFFEIFLRGAKLRGHLYRAAPPRTSKSGERVRKKGVNFHMPKKTTPLFGCKFWWTFHFCYQTWSNFMIWPSNRHSKLTVIKGQFATM